LEIEVLLELVACEIEKKVPIPKEFIISKGNYNGFEELVPTILNQLKSTYEFKYNVNYGHHFPDIDIKINGNTYGIELKSRKNGSWKSNGNSVMESITSQHYEEIYLLFGSYHDSLKQTKVKYDKYWKVTSSINVTHSPRFQINMNTTESVFESSNDYNKLRDYSEKEKVIFLQNYLKEKTNGVKWYVPQEDTTIRPININTLNKEQKNSLITETMILFPQDFFNTIDDNTTIRSKYNRASEHLIVNHFCYSNSFRDLFSAGGKWTYNHTKFPQIFRLLHDNKEYFIENLNNANEDFRNTCYESWGEFYRNKLSSNFKESYFEVIDYLGVCNFAPLVESLPNRQLSSLIK